MWVELGNNQVLEAYRDPQSDDPELVRYKDTDGDRVTRYEFPEGTPLQEAFTSVANSASGFFRKVDVDDGEGGTREALAPPVFIESDSPGMKALLSEHFGVKESATRPKTWGKEFNLNDNEHFAVGMARRAETAGSES